MASGDETSFEYTDKHQKDQKGFELWEAYSTPSRKRISRGFRYENGMIKYSEYTTCEIRNGREYHHSTFIVVTFSRKYEMMHNYFAKW